MSLWCDILLVFLSGFLETGIPDRYAAILAVRKPCDPKLLVGLLLPNCGGTGTIRT